MFDLSKQISRNHLAKLKLCLTLNLKIMNLENLNVTELNTQEKVSVDGGNPWWGVASAIAGALATIHDVVCDSEGRCEMTLTESQSADYYQYRGM
ncbi:MAG: hypothetical protein GVY05_11945 [Bacteroidetes bacterium]|jgi:hypothetical protein|nr:hypothetical protein [Bacteroidota bacterium]